MFEVTGDLAALLILAAFCAGFVDSIAGGGGLISFPALLLAGAPPVVALATNKVQGTFGVGTAMVAYARAGHVDLARLWPMAAISLGAGITGAIIAHLVPAEALRVVIPFVLITVAVFFALKPGLSDDDRVARLTPVVFALTAVPLIAAYDGFFGPGTGSFYMLGFVLLGGFGVLRATAHTKALNFASNAGSLMVFAAMGSVWWGTGLAMGLAQVAGATLGSRLAMQIGAGLIKPLLVTTSGAMALRLAWQAWGG